MFQLSGFYCKPGGREGGSEGNPKIQSPNYMMWMCMCTAAYL